MGGLVATRSIGQLSTLYGGIEDLVVGLEAVFPDGTVSRIKNVPRRAAGPDIRHVVIGNEGALCFITEVTVKLFRFQPEHNAFHGYLVDDLETGRRDPARGDGRGLPPVGRAGLLPRRRRSALRRLRRRQVRGRAGGRGPAPDHRGHQRRDRGDRRVGTSTTGSTRPRSSSGSRASTGARTRSTPSGSRCCGPATSATPPRSPPSWSAIGDLYRSVMRRITEDYPYADDLTLLGAHSSHSYQTGTNLYFVYDYDIDCEPREEIEKYHKPLNAIIVEEALRVGGSMVHHHGIGKYRTDVDRGGARLGVPHPRGAEAGLRPARHHERRHDLPAAVSDLLVGIDLGSQSAKVVVYDDRGSVVAEGREPLAPPLSPAPGVVEHPGDDLWDALCVASRRAMDDLGQARGSIVGIGLCGIRFCRAAAASRRDPGCSGPELDGRAGLPALRAPGRRRGVGDCLVRLPDAPTHGRASRQCGCLPGPVAHRHCSLAVAGGRPAGGVRDPARPARGAGAAG